LDALVQDLRYALRSLRKSPGFTVVAVTMLALGIGVNAAVFTLTNAELFKGVPFDRTDRLAYLRSRNPNVPEQDYGFSYPDFQDWRDQAKSFEGMAAINGVEISLSDTDGLPERVDATLVSADMFKLIRRQPFSAGTLLRRMRRPVPRRS
jgi:hypothetical protein